MRIKKTKNHRSRRNAINRANNRPPRYPIFPFLVDPQVIRILTTPMRTTVGDVAMIERLDSQWNDVPASFGPAIFYHPA